MTQFLYKIGLYVAGVSLLIVINSSIIKEIFSGISSLASALKGAVNAVPNAINTAARTKQSWDTLKGGSGGSGGKSGGNTLGSGGPGGAGGKARGGDKLTAAIAGGAAGAAAAAAIGGGSANPVFQSLNSGMPSPSSASPGIKRGDGLPPAMPEPKMKNPHQFKIKGKNDADLNDLLQKNSDLQKLDPVKAAGRTQEENEKEVQKIAQETGQKAKAAALAGGASEEEAQKKADDKVKEITDAGSQIEAAYRQEIKQLSDDEKKFVSGVDMNKLGSMNEQERTALAHNIIAEKKEEEYQNHFEKKLNEYNSGSKNKTMSQREMKRKSERYAKNEANEYEEKNLPTVESAVEKAYVRASASETYKQNMQALETYNKSFDVPHAGYRFENGGEPGIPKTYKSEGSGEAAFLSSSQWEKQGKAVDRMGILTDSEVTRTASLAKANFEDAATLFARNSNGARNYLDSYQGANDAEKYKNAMDAHYMAALFSVVPETKAVTIINNAGNKTAGNLVLNFNKNNLNDRDHFAIAMNLQNFTTENKDVNRKDRLSAVNANMRSIDMNKKI